MFWDGAFNWLAMVLITLSTIYRIRRIRRTFWLSELVLQGCGPKIQYYLAEISKAVGVKNKDCDVIDTCVSSRVVITTYN